MTCIVGIADGTNVWMAADGGACGSDVIVSAVSPKVVKVDEFLIAYSGDGFGIGQLVPLADYPLDNVNLPIELRLTFCKSMSKLINKYGGVANGSSHLLVGGYGRLFEVYSDDWGIVEVTETSLGTGAAYALGSLYTSQGEHPRTRLVRAVGAAITYSPTCQGPIEVLSV